MTDLFAPYNDGDPDYPSGDQTPTTPFGLDECCICDAPATHKDRGAGEWLPYCREHVPPLPYAYDVREMN